MASSKSELPTYKTDETTTTPVIMNNAREGVDYIVLRLKTEAATIAIRDRVGMETDDLTEVNLSGAQEIFSGIVPDTAFNRKQIQKNNSGSDWSYDLLFADGDFIDVAFPLNGMICSVEIAANNALTFASPLKVDATGHHSLAAAGEDYCAFSLAIVNTGTGTQIIAAWLSGFGVIHD